LEQNSHCFADGKLKYGERRGQQAKVCPPWQELHWMVYPDGKISLATPYGGKKK
jgi:hypothetical protein